MYLEMSGSRYSLYLIRDRQVISDRNEYSVRIDYLNVFQGVGVEHMKR